MSRDSFWMPLDVDDYFADTMHLDGPQHGAYLLLLMHYWRSGPLPDNERQLMSLARSDVRAWRKHIWPVIKCFFVLAEDGLLHQKRSDAERKRATDIMAKRRAAANTRWHGNGQEPPPEGDANAPPQAMHVDSTSNANEMQTDMHSRADARATHFTKKKEDSVLRTGADAPDRHTVGGIRDKAMWDGLPILRALTGYPDAKARGLLGRLFRRAGDDAARVVRILHDAERDRPVDPVAWLMAAARPSRNGFDAILARLDADERVVPFPTLDGEAEDIGLDPLPEPRKITHG